MCVAERAKIELMTKSYPKAASKKLDQVCKPVVRRLEYTLVHTWGSAVPITCIAQNLQVSCLCTYSINDELGATQSGKGHGNAERNANPFQGREKRRSFATPRSRSQFSESTEGSAPQKCEEVLPKQDYPCSHIYNCALCNFCYFRYQPSISVNTA